MSIATEITRLQGIKTDIRTALVTQGIAQASSHNMADFSADILAIQGGSEGVYITVTCDSAYQGYDIILSANESELDRKQCPSSSIVNFFVSADNVVLPATFTISNNHPNYSGITKIVTASMYGWYETELLSVVYLYDNGNKMNTAWKTLVNSSGDSAYDEGTRLKVSNSKLSNDSYAFIYSGEKVSFSGFSKLKFTSEYLNGNSMWCYILPDESRNGTQIHNLSVIIASLETQEIDITGCQGDYYIYFGTWYSNPTTAVIYKLWLE